MPEEIMNILLLILLAVAFIIPQLIKSSKKRQETVQKPPAYFTPQQEEEWPATGYERRFDPITGERLGSHYEEDFLEEQKAQEEFNEDLTQRKLDVNIESSEELPHLSHLHSNIEESAIKSSPLKKSMEEKLSRLSPLKRAIVMSEILKPPKGLE